MMDNAPDHRSAVLLKALEERKKNPKQLELDFDSDEPLPVCNRDQSGDTTCESCQ